MKKEVFKFIILIITLFLSGCDLECVNPGDGVSDSTYKVDVPVKISDQMNQSDPSTLWVDSGIDIKEGQELVLSVGGEINFCDGIRQLGNQEAQKLENECPSLSCKSSVLVPNIFCSGGILPDIAKDQNVITQSELCPASSISSAGYYVDTGLSVRSGDYLVFDLVPYIKTSVLDCARMPSGVMGYLAQDFKYPDGKKIKDSQGKDMNPQEVCQTGQESIIKTKKGEKKIKFGPIQGANINSGIVANNYGPYSNKVFVGKTGRKWINGSIIDLRYILPFMFYDDEFCDCKTSDEGYPRPEYKYKKDCKKPSKELLRFNTHSINYMCGNLNIDGSYSDGVYSLRHDEIQNENCGVFGLTGADDCYRGAKISDDGLQHTWADLLVAKVGGNHNFDSPGYCIYSMGSSINNAGKTGNCIDINNYNGNIPSLALNTRYIVSDKMPDSEKLFLGIAGKKNNYNKSDFSGYNVKVRRYCYHDNGKYLYLYIGDKPSIKPGDPGTHSMENPHTGQNKAQHLFWINPKNDSSEIDKSTYTNGKGRLYFGIKGADASDTVQKTQNGQYLVSSDNKYIVSATQEKWPSNFSAPFMYLYNAVVQLFYGNVEMDDASGVKGGIIKNIYIKFARGLMPAIQATLVLYFILYGMMFMLGMVQNIRSDVVMRLAKIAFVAVLMTDFSWSFFGDTLFNLFVKSTNQLIYYFSGAIGGGFDDEKTFTFLDKTVGLVITDAFGLRMFALLLSGPVGWLIFAIILQGVCSFFACCIEAMITYLMIVIAVGLLLTLAPFFIACILFQRTKQLFEGWLKMITSFALRPIFIFASLAFLNTVLMAVFYELNQFGACRACWISVDIFGDPLCIIKSFLPTGFSNDYNMQDRLAESLSGNSGVGFLGLPISIVVVIVFVIVANTMKAFLKISDSMVDMITGSMMGYGSSGPTDAATNASQALLSVVGMNNQTQSTIAAAKGMESKHKRDIKLEAVEQQKNSGALGTGKKTSNPNSKNPDLGSAGRNGLPNSLSSQSGLGEQKAEQDITNQDTLSSEATESAQGQSEARFETENQPYQDSDSSTRPRSIFIPDPESGTTSTDEENRDG